MMSVSEERLDSTKIGQELKLIQITIKIIIKLSNKSTILSLFTVFSLTSFQTLLSSIKDNGEI